MTTSVHDTLVGSKADISCAEGYQLSLPGDDTTNSTWDSVTVECLITGQWEPYVDNNTCIGMPSLLPTNQHFYI